MTKEDGMILDLKEVKNKLESYSYEIRQEFNIVGTLIPFIEDSTRKTLLQKADQVIEWLYADGSNVAKDIYKAKLTELQASGLPAKERHNFHSEFPVLLSQF